MSKPDPIELLPCPFCGGCATVDAQFGLQWWVECDDCAASTGGMEATRAEAISAWNRRAVPALVQPEPSPLHLAGDLLGALREVLPWLEMHRDTEARELGADVRNLIAQVQRETVAASPSASQPEPPPVTRWPQTAAAIRDFVGSQFCSLEFGREDQVPDDDDKYTMTAHDLISAFDWWTDSLTPPAPEASEHRQLMKFYAVDSLAALVDAQAYHIEKLQAKLPTAPSFAPQRVREG